MEAANVLAGMGAIIREPAPGTNLAGNGVSDQLAGAVIPACQAIPGMKQARFRIGQCVYHRLFDYRGVIVDVDPEFMGSNAWYEQVARSRPPKDDPWYHVLVHDENNRTYVAERNLVEDDSLEPVNHPMLGDFFVEFDRGFYHTGRPSN